MGNGAVNGEPNERLLNVRAEYNAIAQLVGPTSIIRFATLTAFFAFNGILVSRYGSRSPIEWLAVVGVVGNLLLALLELRTINAHRTLINRGSELEKDALSITGGICTRQKDRPGWPWGHGKILICSYILVLVGWLLVIAYCIGWLHGSGGIRGS